MVELLVVIVVFLIGILAIIQIFPKGFQLLIATRNNSVASALERAETARIVSRPDQLPDQILPITYINGVATVNANYNPSKLTPDLNNSIGNYVSSNGYLFLGGTQVGANWPALYANWTSNSNWQWPTQYSAWMLFSGPNSANRIIAEGKRVPAPRLVGSNYGGLMVLNFGPLAPTSPLVAYANDLSKGSTLPRRLTQIGSAISVTAFSGNAAGNSVQGILFDTSDVISPYEYCVGLPESPSAYLQLPTSNQFARTYHLRVSAYILTGSIWSKVDYPELNVTVPVVTQPDANGATPPLVQVNIADILSGSGAISSVQSLGSTEYDSIQVAPEFNQISSTATFNGDPFQYKVMDPVLGVLLFSPSGYATTIERPGGAREPLEARVNYDVYDWRVIRSEFRLDSQLALNPGAGTYGQYRLELQSLKIGAQEGADGLPQGGILPLELAGTPANPLGGVAPTQSSSADNFVLIDIQTGGYVYEVDPNSGAELVNVNKSTGTVTVNSAAPGNTNGLFGYLLIPGTNAPTLVDLTGRSLRALYMARSEWAVQVMKASKYYSVIGTFPPSIGQAYVPTPAGTRIYFTAADVNSKVTIDSIYYLRSDNSLHELDGQDFTITYPTVPDAVGLPCIDIKQNDSAAMSLSNAYGVVAKGIKGASLSVRALWNPATFAINSDPNVNATSIDQWARSWRSSNVQTYLESEVIK
jgi:type II secretory pathway pseudopilin PulG